MKEAAGAREAAERRLRMADLTGMTLEQLIGAIACFHLPINTEQAKELLLARLSSGGDRWQPMETAPHDGTHILAADFSERGRTAFGGMPPQGFKCVVHWWQWCDGTHQEEWGWYPSTGSGEMSALTNLTHWKPLQELDAPPADTEPGSQDSGDDMCESVHTPLVPSLGSDAVVTEQGQRKHLQPPPIARMPHCNRSAGYSDGQFTYCPLPPLHEGDCTLVPRPSSGDQPTQPGKALGEKFVYGEGVCGGPSAGMDQASTPMTDGLYRQRGRTLGTGKKGE